MNSGRKRGSRRPNRGGGRFNKSQNTQNRGDAPRARGRGRGGSGGMARKQDSFRYEDEILEVYDDSHDEPSPRRGGRGRGRTKVQMQHIHMSTENQDMVREMLLALHNPTGGIDEGNSYDDKPEYEEVNWRAQDQYWTSDNQLVIEDAATNQFDTEEHAEQVQYERFTQLAVQKLARYGLAASRCRAALEAADGDIGRALEHLLSDAFSLPLPATSSHNHEEGMGVIDEDGDFEEETAVGATNSVMDEETDWNYIVEQRNEEKLALEAIYGDKFCERIENRVWTLCLDLPKLTSLASEHTGDVDKKRPSYTQKIDPSVCKYYLKGRCKFAKNCKFKHEVIYQQTDAPVSTEEVCDFEYQLEIRFPSTNRYPLEVPYIAFQSTNRLLQTHVCLNVTSRLVQEARDQSSCQLPIVFTLASLLESDEELAEIFFKPPMKYSLPESLVSSRREFSKQNATSNDKPANNQLPSQNHRDFDQVLQQIPGASKVKESTLKHNDKSKARSQDKKKEELRQKYSRKDILPHKLNGQETEKIDRRLKERFKKVQEVSSYREMQGVRRELPAWQHRQLVLDTLAHNQVTVISGMTGCGKTTQVPQYILDASLRSGGDSSVSQIVCTQPRRISAMSVAERVAAERAEKVGGIVGYQVRLDSAMSASTRLLFCTTGILLRRLESDARLHGVTHVVVDEVHERSQESDFLLMILRDLLPWRSDLKVILMSATVNAELFSSYFFDCPAIAIPGKTFPVDEFFLEDVIEMTNYVIEERSPFARALKSMNADSSRKQSTRASIEEIDESLASLDVSAMPPKNNIMDTNLSPKQLFLRYSGYKKKTVKQLAVMDHEKVNFELIETLIEWICTANHQFPKDGAILVFLQGLTDIQTMYDQLKTNKLLGSANKSKFKLVPLHSSLTSQEQKAVFARPPEGVRKIVLSTNMAETSVTIDDIVYVIDCGLMKEKHYDVSKGMESLDSVWVSRANALQRRGRAGRVMAGVCFHLFTGHRYDHHIKDQPVPEMQRAPLEQSILRVKTLELFRGMDVGHVLSQLIEAPGGERVQAAVKRLQELGALDSGSQLTPLGYHLAALPVDVRIGKLMLFGCIFRCLDPALTIAATLSYKSPFVAPFGKKKDATAKKCEFAAGNSDHLTVLRAYQAYEKAAKEGSVHGFCNENFISNKTVEMLGSMKRQFVELLSDIGFVQERMTSRDVGKMARRGTDGVLPATGHTVNCNSDNPRLVAAILVAALYPNVVQVLTPQSTFQQCSTGAVPRAPKVEELKFKTKEDGYVNIHPSSVNFQVRYYESPYLVYHEKLKTSRLFIRDCTMVSVYPLLLFAGGALSVDLDRGNFILSVDDGWIRFGVSSHQVAELIREVRLELDQLLQDKIEKPDMDLCSCPRGNRIITTIVRLITTQ